MAVLRDADKLRTFSSYSRRDADAAGARSFASD